MSLTLTEQSQIILMIKEEHLDIEIIEISNPSYALALKLNDFESLDRITVKITEINRLKKPAEHILFCEAPGIPSPRIGQARFQSLNADIILILDFEYSDSKQIASPSVNEYRWGEYYHCTPAARCSHGKDSSDTEAPAIGGWRRKSDTPSSLTGNNFFIKPSKVRTLEENEEPLINFSDSNSVTCQPFRDKSL